MAQTYQMISIVAFSLAGVFLVVSVILWFKLGIWEIIGDLSGRTAKKSIEQMRAENEKSGIKSYRPSPIAMDRGKLTEAVQLIKEQNNATDKLPEREVKAVNEAAVLDEATDLLDAQTDVLGEATDLLDGQTDMLGGTTVLDGSSDVFEGGTEVLNENFEAFEMIQDIILIHTNETI